MAGAGAGLGDGAGAESEMDTSAVSLPMRRTKSLSTSSDASQESDEIGGSYFTHYLVSGMRGAADANGDQLVTLAEVYGVHRALRFLEPMTVSILSGHRRVPPYGMAGGGSGATGRNWIERVSGVTEKLPGNARAEVNAGDVIVIETPGGGGYGPP